MFNPTELDNVCVQTIHLEERGKFAREGNKKNASNNNSKKNKGKGKNKGENTSTIQKKKSKDQCNHCKKEGYLEAKCWKLHPQQCIKSKWKENKKQAATLIKEVDDGFDVDEKMACMALQGSSNADEEMK